MSTPRRGYRDLVDLVRVTEGVDPVTRRPIPTEDPVATGIRCRIVHRNDRTTVRAADDPARVIIDADALLDPTDAELLDLEVELRHTDGRRFAVAGHTVELGRLSGDPLYARTPLRQTRGRG